MEDKEEHQLDEARIPDDSDKPKSVEDKEVHQLDQDRIPDDSHQPDLMEGKELNQIDEARIPYVSKKDSDQVDLIEGKEVNLAISSSQSKNDSFCEELKELKIVSIHDESMCHALVTRNDDVRSI